MVNRKNFVKLVDTTETHDSKIEMVCCKIIDLEDVQASMEKELARIDSFLKKHETIITAKEPQDKFSSLLDKLFTFFLKYIDWQSFAGGVLALAAILAFIYMKF